MITILFIVAINGILQKYIKSEIRGYKLVQLPDERLMMGRYCEQY